MAFVVFFPTTGACRVFDSYNLAEATYPKQPIIQKGGVLAAFRKYAKQCDSIHDWYERLFEWVDSSGYLSYVDGISVRSPSGSLHKRPKYHDSDDEQTMVVSFWELAVNAGNHVKKLPAPASEKKRGRPAGFRIDLVQANVVLENIKTREVKVPAQVRAMIELFTKQEFDYYTLAEMQRLCNSSQFYQHINTKQDGWRIFRYYTPMMTELGVLK